MLDLNPAHRASDTFAQRFFQSAVSDGLQRAADAFDLERYDSATKARGRNAWSARVLDEYRSQIAFSHLLSDMAEAGLPFDLLSTCTRVVADEARHVEFCRRMVIALGGSNVIDGTPRHVRADPRLPAVVRVLHQVVGSLCIGETLSVRMLAAVLDATTDPLAQETLRILVTDEAVHGRFGWAVLEHLLDDIDEKARRALCAWLPRFLLEAERAFCPPDEGEGEDLLIAGPAMPFGSLSPKDRRAVFNASLRRDVLARFDACGLDGSGAFERAHKLRAA